MKPCIFSLCLLLIGAGALSAAKKPRTDPSNAFFSNGVIPHLKIEIAGTNLTTLKQQNREYVRCTVTDGDKIYTNVGIHLKGAAGSFRPLEDRPALTLNFDKYEAGQEFYGLDKIHLNNSLQDASYLTEIICGEMFREAGVPTTRGTHARVQLNGRDLGFYVLKEGFDKRFLKRYFKNTKGNLYDGGFLRDVTEPLEVLSGDEHPPHKPLRTLVAAANEPDPALRLEKLRKVLDFDQFLTFIALDIMMYDWDGYPIKHNNYRVYHEPDLDKIYFFPHGMDQMFWEANAPLVPPNMEGLVARAILLQSTEGRKLYRQRVGTLLTNVFRLDVISNRIDQIHKRIRPVLASISPGAARDHDGQVQRIKHLITQRAAGIQKQLEAPEPKPLVFTSGIAKLSGWHVQTFDFGKATMSKVNLGDKKCLHIRAGEDGRGIASWRATVLLDPGEYRFEGKIRTAGVVPMKDQKGEGAGLRDSGSKTPRQNMLIGDADWQQLTHDFKVNESEEKTLVAELRALKGEAWFDLESLRLIKQK